MGARGDGNPYAGPRPFVEGERIYGRDAEISSLFYRLSAERIVMLHSPSGAGKSSLLNAGLLPRLKEDGFDVWPVVRLNAPAVERRNPFVTSALASLGASPAQIANGTLAAYVGARLADAPRSRPVLILDQFEEILTLHPLDLGAKQEFFRELGEALKNSRVWALFAFREDYLGALDPYRDDVPTRLGNTFRIDLLTVDAAHDAITGPARDADREFAPDAAKQLANDLATISVQRPDGSFERETGIYVEPLQLQVVCRRLWDELPADTRTIGAEHLQTSGDVDAALAGYYDSSVGEIADDVPTERAVREWFSDRLITPGGIRGQVLREHMSSGGLDNGTIDRLVATHLVRSEERDGKTWFELAHDRLVDPVRKSNTAWLEKHLHPMQRQAALWDRAGRPEGLLLRGQDLKEAERWARDAAASVRPIETDLLSRSARQRRAERRRRITWGVIIVSLVIVSAFIGLLWRNATTAEGKANRAARSSESRALSADARGLLDGHLDSAMTVALDARETADTLDARSALVAAAQRTEGLVRFLRFNDGTITSLAADDRGRIAVAFNEGTIRLLGPRGRPVGKAMKVFRGDRRAINSVAFAPGQPVLAVGADYAVTLRRETRGELRDLPRVTRGTGLAQVTSIAVGKPGKHGQWLAAGTNVGGVTAWPVKGGRLGTAMKLKQIGTTIFSVAFSDPQHVVANTYGDGVWAWDLERPGRRPQRVTPAGVGTEPGGLAFGPHVAAVGSGSRVFLWHAFPSLRRERVCPGGSPTALAFNSTGTILACGMDDGAVYLWDVRSRRLLGPPLRGQVGRIVSLAFEPGTSLLAVAADDNTVALWDAKSRVGALGGSDGFGRHLAGAVFRRDGKIVVLTGAGELKVGALNSADAMPVGAKEGASFNNKLVASADGGKVVVQDGGRLVSGDLLPIRLRVGPSVWQEDSDVPTSPNSSISNDGQVVAGGTFNSTWRWNSKWRPLPALEPAKGLFVEPTVSAISPDGRSVAGYYLAGDKVVLWRTGAGPRQGIVLDTAGSTLSNLVFSPDGSLLAGSGDSEGTIELWHTGKSPTPQSQVLRGSGGPVNALAFSSDGHMMASGGDDGIVRLWDPEGGGELGEPLHVGNKVTGVAFSPNGDRLLALHGGLTLWDIGRWRQANDEERNDTLEQLAHRWCAVVWPPPAACARGARRFPVHGP